MMGVLVVTGPYLPVGKKGLESRIATTTIGREIDSRGNSKQEGKDRSGRRPHHSPHK